MKHVGRMKNNGAKVAVVYRTLPGDSGSALVVGTGSLPESWHDSLMNLIQDPSGQAANELADILAVRRFPDGNVMLNSLHAGGHLKKVPTAGVLMTPTGNQNVTVVLSELNTIIAEQKGVTVDQLAVTDGVSSNLKAPSPAVVDLGADETPEDTGDLTPAQLRSKADALFKQAQALRKQADTIDPPKSKKKEVIAEEAE